MTKDELLALLATDPDVRAAVREAVEDEPAPSKLDADAFTLQTPHRMPELPDLAPRDNWPGWLTRAPHERAT